LSEVTVGAPILTAGFWRTRRSAALAGIVFAVLLLAAMTMARLALAEDSLQTLQADAQRRALIRLSIGLVPFAGIAFLWFIGVWYASSWARLRIGCSPRCSWAAGYSSWPCCLARQ
jgi:hypothetical protein